MHRRETPRPDACTPPEKPEQQALVSPGKHRRPSIFGLDEIGPEPQTAGAGGRSQSPDQSIGVLAGKAVEEEKGHHRIEGAGLPDGLESVPALPVDIVVMFRVRRFNPPSRPISHAPAGVDAGDPGLAVHAQQGLEESPVAFAQDEDRFKAGQSVDKSDTRLLKAGAECKVFEQGVMPGQGAECRLSPGH